MTESGDDTKPDEADDELKDYPTEDPKSKSAKFWHMNTSRIPTDDPLLGCLMVLTRIEHHPFSAEALTAGLPLVKDKLTPELFIRAAKRADLSAQIIRRSLSEISPLVLPAVLLLNDQQACLLVAIKKTKHGKMGQIIQPETGEGLRNVPLEKLEKFYAGYSIFTRPTYRFDARAGEIGLKDREHWFWGVVKKIWPIYSEILVAAFLINIFALVTPLFTMNVYDRVVPNNAIETLVVLALGVGTVYCFDLLMKTLRSYFIDVAGKKADVMLSSVIFEHMLGVKMEMRPESVGTFANNVSQFDSFREFITSATMSTLIDLPFLFLFLIVIYALAGPMVFIPMAAIPLVLITSYFIQKPLNAYVKESYRYVAQKQALLIESLIGTEAIKTLSAEGPIQRKWEQVAGMASQKNLKVKMLSTLATNLSTYIQQITGIAVIIFGVYLIADGYITMGALIACNMLTSRCLSPLAQVASLMSRYHQAMTAFEAVDSVMKMPVERPPGKTPLHRPALQGEIEFKDVSFKYPNQDQYVLKNISFRVRAGEKIGLIGRIGSGKTTIEKLILGLYQPTDGNILFDGTEIQQIDPTVLRRNIGYVPQDVELFFGSVKDNIVIGAPYVDDSAVLRAANIAGITEFVSQHPLGFDLQVGERGDKVSGGQRQSIAIARSLLLDPRIFVFDEPTNMMDTRAEDMFKLKLAQILKGKSMVLVTHKGNLLSLVDRIILIDQGVILADGPKDEVMKALAEGRIKHPG